MFETKTIPLKNGRKLIISTDGKILVDNGKRKYKPAFFFRNEKLMCCIERRSVYIGRIIAENFIPNPNNYHFVEYKTNRILDNSVDNLRWAKNNGGIKKAKYNEVDNNEYKESLKEFKPRVFKLSKKELIVFQNGKVFLNYGGIITKASLKLEQQGGKSKVKKVQFSIGTRKIGLARLVAILFLKNPHGYNYVYHKGGDLWNNNVSNLEWRQSQFLPNKGNYSFYENLDVQSFTNTDKMIYNVYKNNDETMIRLWFLSKNVYSKLKYEFIRWNKYFNPEDLDIVYEKIINLIKIAKLLPLGKEEASLIKYIKVCIRNYSKSNRYKKVMSYNENYLNHNKLEEDEIQF